MLQTQILIQYDGVTTYLGKAASGYQTSDPNWSIAKITHDATGRVIEMLHSGGVEDQIFKWDDRTTLEYK